MPEPYRPNEIRRTVAEVDGKEYVRIVGQDHVRIVEQEKLKQTASPTLLDTVINWLFGKNDPK